MQVNEMSHYSMQLQGRIHSAVLLQVWKAKATPKRRLQTWLLMQDKCLTVDNLGKRGWLRSSPNLQVVLPAP
jgi:hypothetical protein